MGLGLKTFIISHTLLILARTNIQFLNLKTITLLFWKERLLLSLLTFSKIMGYRLKDLPICSNHTWIPWEITEQQIKILETFQSQIGNLALIDFYEHDHHNMKEKK
ncbi:unnamed protein product, partial [Vitis vinifera]|uniref:Uncharacterized protein n=1 Tax=Vitis vinifera TaxID=29760 RepID=D7U9G0_VITVI